MYAQYSTLAVILHAFESGENDEVLLCCTERLGLIAAKATGVRFAKSKLRASLQVGSCVMMTLVKGKSQWKITGATHVAHASSQNVSLLARLAKYIRKAVPLDVRDVGIFSVVRDVCLYDAPMTVKQTHALEHVALMRLMYKLHVWPHELAHEEVLTKEYSPLFLEESYTHLPTFRPIIQRVLTETIL